MVNIFLASLIIAQFEVALIATFHTLHYFTQEEYFKKAINRSAFTIAWFFGISMYSLGVVVFLDEPIDENIPKILFILIIIGAILIGLTMLAAIGKKWRGFEDILPSRKTPETRIMERKEQPPPQ